MITIDSKIPEMKTRRLSITHGEDVFLRARDMYAANPPIRKLPYYLLHMELLMLLAFAFGIMDDLSNIGPALLGKLFAVFVITLGICTLWAIGENKIKEKKWKSVKK
ncbi:MAG: hypothetical protein K5668_07130 [Lachnospiraceae bacterium]|nr:hypothetical protein [Lachnospiraceae bacterium]